MVVYEVTATVDLELCEDYEVFMRERHIPDLLATKSFVGASFERSTPGRYRIRYIASSRESLDAYLSDAAPRLRTDFANHFPFGVELSREEWTVIESFA